jgi:hypothetical protein
LETYQAIGNLTILFDGCSFLDIDREVGKGSAIKSKGFGITITDCIFKNTSHSTQKST